ncbi:MAG TPA: glutathione S-transferase family protein [Parvularculaceae bacterium]|mgnify:CR=1 FL=1|nr:glutathione S-transferase family protein [Parvularculaceae bacterium]HNS86559.1 glutathione S-transferase family protein [Parvularculaceae bacterium]
MAAIKIYGIPLSQNVRKPLAVAAQLGVAVENVPVRPMDEVVQGKNPARRIPFMEDGDVVLGESNAIMIHLCSKKPNDLYPEDRNTRDRVNQFLFWDAAHWTPAYQPIQFERLVKQLLGLGAPDEKIVAATLEKFKREAGYLNAALEGRDWLVGGKPTLADFAVGCGLTHAKGMDLPLSDYPNIQAWNARVMNLEGFKKTAG